MTLYPNKILSNGEKVMIEEKFYTWHIPDGFQQNDLPIKYWDNKKLTYRKVFDNLHDFASYFLRSRPQNIKKQISIIHDNKKYITALFDTITIERSKKSGMVASWIEFSQKEHRNNDFQDVLQVKYNSAKQIISILVDTSDTGTEKYREIPIVSCEGVPNTKKSSEEFTLVQKATIKKWMDLSLGQKLKYFQETINQKSGYDCLVFGRKIVDTYVGDDGILGLIVKHSLADSGYDCFDESVHGSKHDNYVIVVKGEKIYKTTPLIYSDMKANKLKKIKTMRYDTHDDSFNLLVQCFDGSEKGLSTRWGDTILFNKEKLHDIYTQQNPTHTLKETNNNS